MKRPTRVETDSDLLENVAAIAAEMHRNPRAYQQFYARYGAALGGFPGIYGFCVDMARAFTRASPEDWDRSDVTWLDAVGGYVDSVLAMADTPGLPDSRTLWRLARQVVRPACRRCGVAGRRSVGAGAT